MNTVELADINPNRTGRRIRELSKGCKTTPHLTGGFYKPGNHPNITGLGEFHLGPMNHRERASKKTGKRGHPPREKKGPLKAQGQIPLTHWAWHTTNPEAGKWNLFGKNRKTLKTFQGGDYGTRPQTRSPVPRNGGKPTRGQGDGPFGEKTTLYGGV